MRDAVPSCAVEHRQAVVDQQGARRVEGLDFAQPLPELLLFLRRAERVRTDDGVEVRREPGLRHLQRHALVVRVGRQHHAAAAGAQGIKEGRNVRMDVDQVRHFLLEAHDVEFERGFPEVHRVPLQGSGAAVVARHQFLAPGRRRHAARLGIALRQVHLPEMVVEIQVEQGAVHVEQDGVDARPVDHRGTHSTQGRR
jgi:hypothetical protein